VRCRGIGHRRPPPPPRAPKPREPPDPQPASQIRSKPQGIGALGSRSGGLDYSVPVRLSSNPSPSIQIQRIRSIVQIGPSDPPQSDRTVRSTPPNRTVRSTPPDRTVRNHPSDRTVRSRSNSPEEKIPLRPGSFAKETLSFLEINPQSMLVQKVIAVKPLFLHQSH
jgi:hypothetical protein